MRISTWAQRARAMMVQQQATSETGDQVVVTGGNSNSNSTNSSPRSSDKRERLRRKSLAFLTSLFKSRRRCDCLAAGLKLDDDQAAQPRCQLEQKKLPRSEQPPSPAGGGVLATGCRSHSAFHERTSSIPNNSNNSSNSSSMDDGTTMASSSVSRIPSTLSVADVMVACRQASSPSHSILTLTPGRTRNIDQDMEALRLSRQDNPFLQVLASKESLIEPAEESESDDAILMSQEFGDTDSLTLQQVHEHMVRSPPPASWSRTPYFHFPHQPQDSPGSKSEPSSTAHHHQQHHQQHQHCRTTSPRSMMHQRLSDDQPKSEGSMETRDRHSHTFSLLNPTPIRSLSEVRRLHRSAEDSVQLMSSE